MTGSVTAWGIPAPGELTHAGWIPVDEEMAKFLNAIGESGVPVQAAPVIVEIHAGEELQIFREVSVVFCGGEQREMVVYNIGIRGKFMIQISAGGVLASSMAAQE